MNIENNSEPKVSIIIPVFNGENYLKEAIDSALNQTYTNIEIIVINDGSNDATEEIATSYGEKILYIEKANGGVASALNAGIREMSGDYFSWLSHDDLYLPMKIEQQINFLSSSGLLYKNFVVYSDFITFSNDSSKMRHTKVPCVKPINLRLALMKSSFINGCTLLIPRTAFNNCGFFNEGLRHTQDYDMWLRMASSYTFIKLDNEHVKSRVHNLQDSVKLKDDAIKEIDRLFVGYVHLLNVNDFSEVKNSWISYEYLKLFLNFKIRGFDEAAEAALSLGYAMEQSYSTFHRVHRVIFGFIEISGRFLVRLYNFRKFFV